MGPCYLKKNTKIGPLRGLYLIENLVIKRSLLFVSWFSLLFGTLNRSLTFN